MNRNWEKFIKASKRYASYYETGDDESKEADIIRCWLDSKYRGNPPFLKRSHLIDGQDPPDFVFERENSETLGVEITELVDRETVYQWSKGNQQYYIWNASEIAKRVESILRTKERKIEKKHGDDLSMFTDLWLLIHTDEGTLRYEMLKEAFNQKEIKSSVFSQIHILMAPEPYAGGYLEGDPENHPLSDRNVNQLYEIECQPDGCPKN